MRSTWKAIVLAVCGCQAGLAQVAQVTILEIVTENRVNYGLDVFDPSKIGTDPNVTTLIPQRNFRTHLGIADIVAVNGRPAKGNYVIWIQTTNMTPTPIPGQAIADTLETAINRQHFNSLIRMARRSAPL
ncbi:MAG: hypothetical protein HY013_02005 [Candidatus Solibacter usitatus]|nr:hypothetical protein [Candidatus Solibacter usitatus]